MMKHRIGMARLLGCAGLAISATAFGQVNIVNSVSGTFTDISGSGGPIVTGDDESGPVTVSGAVANAAFPTGTLNVCTNGHAGYGGADTEYFNEGTTGLPYPWTDYTYPVAAVYFDDLITNATGAGVYAQEVTEGGQQVLVVEWVRMDHFSSTPGNATFELKIYGGAGGPMNSYAQYLYQTTAFGDGNDNGASATVGYQYNASAAETYSYDTPGSIPDGLVLSLVQGTTGACCLPDGTCAQLSSNNCANSGGVYRGDNSPCGTANCPSGACCTSLGCIITGPTGCTNAGGVYHGDGSTCAQAGCPQTLVANGGFETGDFTGWTQFGDTTFDGVDDFIPHSGQFEAFFGATDPSGSGVQQTITANMGDHIHVEFWLLEEGGFTPNSATVTLGNTTLLSLTDDTTTTDYTLFQYDTIADSPNPMLTFTFYNPTSYWDLDDVFVYNSNPTGPSCYPNCDGSTNMPFLNVNDFICFQNKFAAGDTYANCDHSTNPPVLNVNDFICFQSSFAAGCSAP